MHRIYFTYIFNTDLPHHLLFFKNILVHGGQTITAGLRFVKMVDDHTDQQSTCENIFSVTSS